MVVITAGWSFFTALPKYCQVPLSGRGVKKVGVKGYMNTFRLGAVACVVAASLFSSGCATLDKSSVAASNNVPGHNQVEAISVPYDPKLPKFVVAVEPFRMDDSEQVIEASSTGSKRCIGGECTTTITNKTVGHGVSAQLVTALTNAGNLSVVDMAAVKKQKGGLYSTRIGKGEKGPYIIRGVVTEFTENAQSSERNNGASLGWAGTVAGIAGAVTGNRGLFWAGAGVSAANPSFASQKREKTGMIAFDVQVVNGKNGRIVKSFNVVGTFTAQSATNGVSLFGIGTSKTEFAQSVLGQAMRVAMNDAVQKTVDALKGA